MYSYALRSSIRAISGGQFNLATVPETPTPGQVYPVMDL